MIKCPCCNLTAMSLWQKSALGPGRAVPCHSCGKLVAAHWVGILAATPAFLGGFAFMKAESAPLGFAAVVGGLIAMGVLQTFFVPLMKHDA